MKNGADIESTDSEVRRARIQFHVTRKEERCVPWVPREFTFQRHLVRSGEVRYWSSTSLNITQHSGIWIRSSVFLWLTDGTNRQTDHATCVATGRIFTLCIAMRTKNYSERQNWRHQFRGQHEWNKARCTHRTRRRCCWRQLHARDVCSCTSQSVFVYRVRALSAATSIYIRPVCT